MHLSHFAQSKGNVALQPNWHNRESTLSESAMNEMLDIPAFSTTKKKREYLDPTSK